MLVMMKMDRTFPSTTLRDANKPGGQSGCVFGSEVIKPETMAFKLMALDKYGHSIGHGCDWDEVFVGRRMGRLLESSL
jgi:hypothetical protein